VVVVAVCGAVRVAPPLSRPSAHWRVEIEKDQARRLPFSGLQKIFHAPRQGRSLSGDATFAEEPRFAGVGARNSSNARTASRAS